jgi:hypothetical protein
VPEMGSAMGLQADLETCRGLTLSASLVGSQAIVHSSAQFPTKRRSGIGIVVSCPPLLRRR